MSLIKCSECGNQVSDKAVACPNCGNPINRKKVIKQVTTIQQTSKKYKAMQLVCFIIIGIGLLIAIINQQGVGSFIGLLIIIGGAIGTFIVKFLAWWNHG